MTQGNGEADDMAEALMREALESVERRKQEAKEESAGVEVDVDVDAPASPAPGAAAEPQGSVAVRRPGEDADAEAARLRELIEKVEAARKDAHEKWMRTLADLENFRKRAQKERAEIKKFGHEAMALEMLGVLDNLERALEAARSAEQTDPTLAKFVEGVEMTQRQFLGTLERFEVRPFASTGQGFDPARHQAVSQVPTAEAAPGTVLSEMQKGYFIFDRLLRPAMVTVAREPDEAPAESQEPAGEAPAEAAGPAEEEEESPGGGQ